MMLRTEWPPLPGGGRWEAGNVAAPSLSTLSGSWFRWLYEP